MQTMAHELKTSGLTPKERLKLGEFLAALNLFSELEPTMPLQMVRAFVSAALHEGEGSVEVGLKIGLPSGVIARHLGAYGEFDRYGRPGLKMIEGRLTPEDRRSKLQYLNVKGRRFLESLLMKLQGKDMQ
jgi:hypothetical protein